MTDHLESCVAEAIQKDDSAGRIEEFKLGVDKFIR
jgi:hypothetical protein